MREEKFQVCKRDGEIVNFEIKKIENAIEKAFNATNKLYNHDILSLLALRTTAELQNKVKDETVSVEDIQDCVEHVLEQSGYTDVAKAYILYRKNRENLRNMKSTILDYKEIVNSYVKEEDWRVKENSTVTYSVGGLILHNSGAVTANYWLSEIYDQEIADAHRNADIHIHDLSMLTGYCFTGDTRIALADGTTPTFKELEGRESVTVLSFDTDGCAIVEAKAVHPRVTRCTDKLVQVSFSDGTSVCCTPDHPFLLTDNRYLAASKLEPGQALRTCGNICTVRSVTDISPADGSVNVYDLTVPGYNNFALANGVFVHNCAGWSLKQLLKEGLGGIPGKITSAPAKHLSTLCNQMVNFLGIMQNEWAGAQAFSSFDTYLAPFVKVDNLSYEEVKQCIQSFVYGVNTPSRWGTQAPFSNITLDWTVPSDLAELPCIIGGKEMDFCYKDCKKEMDMVNKAFIEIMIEGDCNGRGFQYPIPTYSITRDFDWSDTENNRLLFEMTAKYGTPYFSNYINSDMEPSDVRSMCCRLRLDLRELRKKTGGFFGSGESTGSVGVVTINMPRIAYNARNEKAFFKQLDKMMDIAARSLKVKREVITRLMKEGLYPYTKRYLGTFENHFSTIGLVGMNEVGLNASWLRKDMTHPETQEFTKKVLNHMRERLSDYQEQYGDLYNLEATPAESTSYRLAKHDKQRWPNIITAGEDGDTPYYTNSSHLPVGYTADIFEALDIQDEIQTLYTSGTVFHAFLGEKLPDWKAAAKLVRTIAENYHLPYYTLSPTYSICKTHGYISGEHFTCPECGEEAEVYSRITGYYRPVQNWNAGKAQEYKNRKTYDPTQFRPMPDSRAENTETAVETEAPKETALGDGLYLFTTKTCPNCRIAKALMKNLDYQAVDAEENAELSEKLQIRQAPTLVIVHGDQIEKVNNLSEIKKFVDNQSIA